MSNKSKAIKSESILIRLEYAVVIGLLLFGAGIFVGVNVLKSPSAPPAHHGAEASQPVASSSDAEGMGEIMTTSNYAALVNLGNKYYDEHRMDLSIAAYEKALKNGPDNPDIRTDLGTMYRERGLHNGSQEDLDRALEEYSKALKLNPDHENALLNTGIVSMDKGNHAMAIGVWKKLISKNPDSPVAAQAKELIKKAEKK